MVGESRIPPGVSLLLIGSGLYWILSSQLISSFTVLTPGLFQDNTLGGSLITVVGTISAAMGLSIVRVDIDKFPDSRVESVRLICHRDRLNRRGPLHPLVSSPLARPRSLHVESRRVPFRSFEVLQVSPVRSYLWSGRVRSS